MQYRVKSHPVTVSRIVSVGPLVAQSKMMSPEAGLVLGLENQAAHNWLAEKDGDTPQRGDWFVNDAELRVSYVVAAAKFSELFQASE
jgi:hypothetical protein